MTTEHSASRRADLLPRALLASTPTSTRRKAIEEIIVVATELSIAIGPHDALTRIVELGRFLYRVEPGDEHEWKIVDDFEVDNKTRARAALVALAGDPLTTGLDLTDEGDLANATSDLIANLLHLAEQGGVDAQQVVDSAFMHYNAERRHEH